MPVSIVQLSGMMRRLLSRRLAEEPWMAEAKLRPPSFAVMMVVQQRQPVSQKQVSDRLGIDPSDLVAIFDLLEQAGFIVRERDEKDRRRYALSLTELGKVRLRRFEELAAEVSQQLFAVLDPDELETLGRLVQRAVDEQLAVEE
ncbi:MAG: MarR family winged helix-turn-helix transcriptional regulator [Acidimicrobiia bacterium]